MNYVIGDVHGAGNELRSLVAKINPTATDKIILVGDVFDRGKHGHIVWEMIQEYNMDVFMGNHELKMLQFLKGSRQWLPNHYYWAINNLFNHGVDPEKLTNFLESLPTIRRYFDDFGVPFLVAHAGVDPNAPNTKNVSYNIYGNCPDNTPMPRPHDRDGKVYWWNLYLGETRVYYGHLVTPDGLPRYHYAPSGLMNSCGLDTAAVHGGPLTAVQVESNHEPAVGIIQYQSGIAWHADLKEEFKTQPPSLLPEIWDYIYRSKK